VDTPVITSRDGLWAYLDEIPVVTGLRTDRPELLVTSIMRVEPIYRHEAPQPTLAPLGMAAVIAAMLITGIFTPWGVVYGTFAIALPFYIWAWPDREQHEKNLHEERHRREQLELV